MTCDLFFSPAEKKLLVGGALTMEKAFKVAIADEAVNIDVAKHAKARGLGLTNEVHLMKATVTSSKSLKSKTNKKGNP